MDDQTIMDCSACEKVSYDTIATAAKAQGTEAYQTAHARRLATGWRHMANHAGLCRPCEAHREPEGAVYGAVTIKI